MKTGLGKNRPNRQPTATRVRFSGISLHTVVLLVNLPTNDGENFNPVRMQVLFLYVGHWELFINIGPMFIVSYHKDQGL